MRILNQKWFWLLYGVATFGALGSCDKADQYSIEAEEKVMRPARVIAYHKARGYTMPPATAFEQPHNLLRLTPPVRCVRLPGTENMGREWLRQWGDGGLPPAVPTCVRASL